MSKFYFDIWKFKIEIPIEPKLSANVFSGSNIVKSNFERPSFAGGKIVISEDTKIFLENLLDNDTLKYTAYRGWLRSLQTAVYEGRSFQSRVWVCGPGATAKSSLVEIAKRMFVDSSRIKEFSRDINQFTV